MKEDNIATLRQQDTNLRDAIRLEEEALPPMPADKDGVRIAELDEMSYRRELWNYRPITKFWRVGRGIAEKLALYGVDTMGKLARMSV